MRIQIDDDGDVTNGIVNHPEVLPTFTSARHPLDMRPLAKDPSSLILVGTPPKGAFIFMKILDGVYEAHGAVMPEMRGEWARELADGSVRHMFTATDCIEIMTRIPQGHLPTMALVKHLKFVERWQRPEISFRGKLVPFSVWSLTMQDWWPSGEAMQKVVLEEMRKYGPPNKAANWYARWAHLSRTG